MAGARRVAVVDDDESIRESLPELLKSCGLEAEPFASAEAFLGSGALGRTDCLVLDVSMPGMTGLELQAELARREEAIPIIFITAHSVSNVGSTVIERGAVACLFKPFSELAILDAVNAALGLA